MENLGKPFFTSTPCLLTTNWDDPPSRSWFTIHPMKTKMTKWKNPAMNEDVSPIKDVDFPFSHVSFLEGSPC